MKETVVVTGASRGIGRALAVEFAARGHPLVLAARSRSDVQGTQVECDLSTPEGREKLLAASPQKIGGLVNNAGFATAGPFAEQDRSKERDMVRLNVEAVVDLCHLFLPRQTARPSRTRRC